MNEFLLQRFVFILFDLFACVNSIFMPLLELKTSGWDEFSQLGVSFPQTYPRTEVRPAPVYWSLTTICGLFIAIGFRQKVLHDPVLITLPQAFRIPALNEYQLPRRVPNHADHKQMAGGNISGLPGGAVSYPNNPKLARCLGIRRRILQNKCDFAAVRRPGCVRRCRESSADFLVLGGLK